MTIGELRAALADVPDHWLVEVADQEQGPAYAWPVEGVRIDPTPKDGVGGVCLLAWKEE